MKCLPHPKIPVIVTSESINGWMDGWADGWMDECMDGCMNGWMDRWMDGGWMDR